MGSLFSGKKTQAKLLTDKFEHLKSYYIPDIIKELKEIKLKSEEKIEDNPKFKSMKKNEALDQEKEQLFLSKNLYTNSLILFFFSSNFSSYSLKILSTCDFISLTIASYTL